MNRKHNFNFDILYDEDRTRIDFDGELSDEEIFCFYEIASHLVNLLYWREVNKEKTTLTKEQIKDMGITSSTLKALSSISGSILMGFEKNMKDINKILNKGEDEV